LDVLKRPFDVIMSGLVLVVASPVMALAALAVRLRLRKPVLFKQLRAGRLGVPFTIYKFRTMHPPAPGASELENLEARLTPLGRFLRTTSIDELPELYNVIKGDMSLVGPRPFLTSYLDLYTPEQARRLLVRPGLTGLAQVQGRNVLTWQQRFALDVEYVYRQSLWLDLKILVMSFVKVLSLSNVSVTEGEYTGEAAASLTGERQTTVPLLPTQRAVR
jgi:sugar transferase EpsL